ncbi:MAG TPA: NCS2 family permease, partial [Sedimentibacter sp.]|nr:NCS2 family permease [Sedimentibacter sp.]
SAISPALIVVGVFMIKGMTGMRLDDYTESIPAFLTIIFIPLTFSIGNGIMVGLLSYTILKILCGKYREVSITTFVISLFFLIKLFIGF